MPSSAPTGVAAVYPRVCGGTRYLAPPPGNTQGLSPRVRGNQSAPGARQPVRRVYPRVCGGTSLALNTVASREGLSPRVRGNRVPAPSSVSSDGSIPACAGEPRRAGRQCPACRVYPRVCGGTAGLALGCRPAPGKGCGGRGSIPACAGEPLIEHRLVRKREVYPRVCGGTSWMSAIAVPSHGLSPRVRGNLSAAVWSPVAAGSIPACAGEPFPMHNDHVRGKVYPRVCGGTRARLEYRRGHPGLSPRVRGNPHSPYW